MGRLTYFKLGLENTITKRSNGRAGLGKISTNHFSTEERRLIRGSINLLHQDYML
jgi:hypothetical protein